MKTLPKVARRAGSNLARGIRRVITRRTFAQDKSNWVEVRLRSKVRERRLPPSPFSHERYPTLLEILQILEQAAVDSRVDGVLLRFEGGPASLSQAHALRRAVWSLREQGKPVAAYGEAIDTPALLVASAATRFWIPEAGSLFLVGIRLESTFLGGLLERLQVEPELIRVGRYKAMAERFTRERMSPAEREQLEALADDLYCGLVQGIAEGRGLEEEAVRDIIDAGPYRGRAALEVGLVDACLYPDEIEEQLAELSPLHSGVAPRAEPGRCGGAEGGSVQRIDASTYHRLCEVDFGFRPMFRELPRIGYVVALGPIHRGRAGRGIDCEDLQQIFEKLRKTDSIRAVVLRIESPGGDSLAADLLWRSLELVSREKPVVVSMGDVAASGGYYISVAGDALLAEKSTVTGSIGVVGGKVNLSGLYQQVGIGKDAVERGARAGLLSESRGFTDDERKAVRDEMASVYAGFADRVASGRDLPPEQIARVGEGRIWSGARALSLGLIDAIGGPLEALREARRRAGLLPDERVVIEVLPRAPRFALPNSLSRLLPP